MSGYTPRGSVQRDVDALRDQHNQQLASLNAEREKLRKRLRAITMEMNARKASLRRMDEAERLSFQELLED